MSAVLPGVLVGAAWGWAVLMIVHGWRATTPDPPLIRALAAAQRPGTRDLSAGAVWVDSARRWVAPVVHAAVRMAGGRDALTRRLRRAGRSPDHAAYLWSQMAWSCAGAAGALLLVGVSGSAAGPVQAVVVMSLGFGLGAVARDWWLTREVRRRRDVVAEQFPVAAELLALSVSAGHSPQTAVDRVAHALGGPLGLSWQAALNDVAGGARFGTAMRAAATETGHEPLIRFTDAMVAAIDRGTALADTARAQAVDARSEGHRLLMEAAGRKDVAMLVPVVFLVLPLVVLIALFPGAVELGLFG